jgi:hypothetical protein
MNSRTDGGPGGSVSNSTFQALAQNVEQISAVVITCGFQACSTAVYT